MGKIGLGYTTLPEVQAAASHLVEKAVAGLEGKPSLAILLSTSDIDVQQLVSAVQDCLHGVPLWGGTSSSGVFTNHGWVSSENGAAALMLIAGRPAGVGAAVVEDDAQAAAQETVRQAVAGAGGAAMAFLSMPVMGKEDALMQAMADLAPGVPVVGGASGESGPAGSMRQYANDKAYAGGYSVAALGGEAGYAFIHGYHPTGKQAKITEATGRRIVSLDNRPAMEVYAEWTGLPAEAIQGGNILVASTRYPLILHIDGATLSVHPVSGNADGTIDTGVTHTVGTTVELMENTIDGMLDEVAHVVKLAAENVSKPSAIFLSHCAGRALALGDRISEVPAQVRRVVGDIPMIGFLAFGEQGMLTPTKPMHGNLSLSALVLGEE